MPAKSTPVYQLKITLRNIKPPVWRRVLVKDCTLAKLHDVIQTCMDWTNSHLHDFQVGHVRIGMPDPDGTMEYDAREDRIKLSALVDDGARKFDYVYDFGDTWVHNIQVEKVLPAEPGVRYPRCIAGKRSGPPEDCGGPWGYANLLTTLADPAHKDHQEMSDWVPADFDPEALDLDFINEELRALR